MSSCWAHPCRMAGDRGRTVQFRARCPSRDLDLVWQTCSCTGHGSAPCPYSAPLEFWCVPSWPALQSGLGLLPFLFSVSHPVLGGLLNVWSSWAAPRDAQSLPSPRRSPHALWPPQAPPEAPPRPGLASEALAEPGLATGRGRGVPSSPGWGGRGCRLSHALPLDSRPQEFLAGTRSQETSP